MVITELPELSESSESYSMLNPEHVPSPAILDFMASNQSSPVNGPPLEMVDPLPAAANSPAVNKRKKNNAP